MNSLVFWGSSWLWFLFTIQFLLSCYPERWNRLDTGRAWVCRLVWAAGRLGFRGHPQNRVTGIWGQIGFLFFNLLSLIIETFSVAYPGGHRGHVPPGGLRGAPERRCANERRKEKREKKRKKRGRKREGAKKKRKEREGGERKKTNAKEKWKRQRIRVATQRWQWKDFEKRGKLRK